MWTATGETSSKQRRAGGKRSRTGCRTCRVRHVKCDETPGSCQNCTSTGRTCDGYDLHRLPRGETRRTQSTGPESRHGRFSLLSSSTSSPSSSSASSPLPGVVLADGFRWAMTSDERLCFSHFLHHTIPTLLELFDSPLWNRVVLQMAYSEPAVYHAAVGLSAVHRDMELQGVLFPGRDRDNASHRFAMEQTGRSFALLNRRHSSQDPRLKEVTLLCCLLFVLVELLRGRYDHAMKHLRGGLGIVKESQQTVMATHGQRQNQQQPIPSASLIAAFAHLDTQSAFFGVGGPQLSSTSTTIDVGDEPPSHHQHHHHHHDHDPPSQRSLDYYYPAAFSSVDEARITLEPLMQRVFEFLAHTWFILDAEVALDYDALQAQQGRLFSQLNRFALPFEALYNGCYATLDRKAQRGADIIYVLRRSLSLAVQTCLIPKNSGALDWYATEYTAHLDLVESILRRFPERPSVVLSPGVIPVLYLTAVGCRDYGVQLRAVQNLQSWPHYEGSFNSSWVCFLMVERMQAELRGPEGAAEEEESAAPTVAAAMAATSNISGSVTRAADIPTAATYRPSDAWRELIWQELEQVRRRIVEDTEFSLQDAIQTASYVADWPCVRSIQASRQISNQ